MRATTAWAFATALFVAPAAMAQAPQPGTGSTSPPPATSPGMNPPAAPSPGTPAQPPGTSAQPGMPAQPGAPAQPGTPQRSEGPPTTATPTAGANSFTEGQARRRIEEAGFTDIQNLRKDEQGVWRGQGMRNGARADVGLDFRGNVVIGNAPAAR